MNMRISLAALLLASALPLAAHADGVAANLSGSYVNLGSGSDGYNIDGAVSDTFGSAWGGNWGGEITGGYHNLAGSVGNGGGAVFWQGSEFRFAVNGNYFSAPGFHLANYGAGGEWYASPSWTFAVRGGGVSGQSGISGGYVGGDAKFYITPNLSVDGGVDYLSLNSLSLTSESVRAEWLVSQSTPISVFGGYEHTDSGIAGNIDAFIVGIKIYTNDAPGALVDRQRGGNLGYIDGLPYLGSVL